LQSAPGKLLFLKVDPFMVIHERIGSGKAFPKPLPQASSAWPAHRPPVAGPPLALFQARTASATPRTAFGHLLPLKRLQKRLPGLADGLLGLNAGQRPGRLQLAALIISSMASAKA
jgi:hypothetical protein